MRTKDLPLIQELLTDDEHAELLRRMVQVVPNGPLLDYRATLQARRTLPVSRNAARKARCRRFISPPRRGFTPFF